MRRLILLRQIARSLDYYKLASIYLNFIFTIINSVSFLTSDLLRQFTFLDLSTKIYI